MQWRKREGERVEKGEVLLVIETEKVTYEVEAPASGVLGSVVVGEGETVPVGTLLAQILEPGEVPARPEKEEARISPLARRLAQEHGIDLATIRGTGPGGRVVKEDVLRAVAEGEKAKLVEGKEEVKKPAETIVPLTMMRKTIARRMTESFTAAPHFYLTVEADALELQRAQEALSPKVEKRVGVRLTISDLLVKICARALEEFPQVNATWTEQGIKLYQEINIGLATAVEGGLLVPVLSQANKRPLEEIAARRADLVERGRQGKLHLDEVQGSTFTISNIGMLGVEAIHPIINPPEAALLGVGAIREKPVVVAGEVKVRHRMLLVLAADHRVLDGASASPFLLRVKELIENPLSLLL